MPNMQQTLDPVITDIEKYCLIEEKKTALA